MNPGNIVRALVYINSDINEKVAITNEISLCPISEEFKAKYLKQSYPYHTFNSDLNYINYYFEFVYPDINGSSKTYELVDNLNLTLKVIKTGSSGIILTVFDDNVTSRSNLNCKIEFFVLKQTEINHSDLFQFNKILKIISERKNDKKIKLFLSKYNYATSGIDISFENRFIDLMTIIEMLYLINDKEPKKETIHNRINELLKIKIDVRSLYEIRSDIVHEGDSINLTNESFLSLVEITRKSILEYLYDVDKEEDKKQFSENKLKEFFNAEKPERKCKRNKDKLCKDCDCEVKP